MAVDEFQSPLGPEIASVVQKVKPHAIRAGIGESFVEFFKSTDCLVQCEIAHRKAHLAKKLRKSELMDKHMKKEKQLHDKSIAQIEKTLKTLRRERKKHDKEKIKEIDKDIKNQSEFKEFRNKSIEAAQTALLESGADPDIAYEITEKQEIVLDTILREKGFNGLLDHAEEQLEELKTVRSTRKNRGRDEYNDDINIWKALTVIAALCLCGVAAYACFKYSLVTIVFVGPVLMKDLFLGCLAVTWGIIAAFAGILCGIYC